MLTIIINKKYSAGMETKRTALALFSSSLLVLAGCSSAEQAEVADAPTSEEGTAAAVDGASVVVTTTILGSVVGEILTCAVGSDASMTVVMPVGADPHDFQPSSEQVAAMSTADVVVSNGLFLEEGLVSVLQSLETDGVNVLHIAELVDPIPFADDHGDDHGDDHADDHGDDHADESSEEHAHGDFDPHFWFDMERMALAAELIGSELATATGVGDYDSCGVSVAADVRSAEADVIAVLQAVPDASRVLVTDHDAFGYFAERYDFEVAGVVVPGGSTLSDPSSRELAELVNVIERENVTAIFANTATASDVVAALAAEVGRDIQVVPLFVGSLGGPGSGAEDYISMMSLNASLIADALTD
ncbi:MAG: metal ABC transporter substrate-binding protein [Pontimonas sp.]|nr:metal ABC transporter substrate-binding protein [Pontimonas sp.]